MVEQVVKTHSLQQQEDTDSTRNVRGEVRLMNIVEERLMGSVVGVD